MAHFERKNQLFSVMLYINQFSHFKLYERSTDMQRDDLNSHGSHTSKYHWAKIPIFLGAESRIDSFKLSCSLYHGRSSAPPELKVIVFIMSEWGRETGACGLHDREAK